VIIVKYLRAAGEEKPDFISSIKGRKDELGKILVDYETYKEDENSESIQG